MKQRKVIITALIRTIICVIICTCVFVVIKSNKKTDIESEDSDYVYGASVENYDNMVDELRTAKDYNLGAIRVTERQGGRIGRAYRYSEGIGGIYESRTPSTHDVVENVNINLGLTGDDRLCVEDVVNSGDKSLTGSDKVHRVNEEILKKVEENVTYVCEDYYDSIISSEYLQDYDNGTTNKFEAYAGYRDNYYSDTDSECYENLVLRDADGKIVGYNDAAIKEIIDKDSKDITSEECKALALLFVGEDCDLDMQELTRIQTPIINACYDLTNTENYVDIHLNDVTLHMYEKNGLFDILLTEIKNIEADIYAQLDILSAEEMTILRESTIWYRTEQCLVLLDILAKTEGAVIPELNSETGDTYLYRETPIIMTRAEEDSIELDVIAPEDAYAGYYTMDSRGMKSATYTNYAERAYNISRLKHASDIKDFEQYEMYIVTTY